jgi:hypothetical protein
MNQWKEILWTVLRVFFGTLIASAIAIGVGVMDYGWTEWKPLVFAALAAASVVVINALNPKETRYGIGAGSE